jgi:hypothetical protein
LSLRAKALAIAQFQNTLTPRIKDSGITILAEPADGEAILEYVDPIFKIYLHLLTVCSVVFVHGFNGYPRDTWLDEPTMFFWL